VVPAAKATATRMGLMRTMLCSTPEKVVLAKPNMASGKVQNRAEEET
jgi:hypothetical protein